MCCRVLLSYGRTFIYFFFRVCVPFPRLFQWILLDHNTPIQFKGLVSILLFFFRNFFGGGEVEGGKRGCGGNSSAIGFNKLTSDATLPDVWPITEP